MATFTEAYSRTAQNEGGYVNDTRDRGGETYMGISRKNFPNWNGWTMIDMMKLSIDFPKSLDKIQSLKIRVMEFYKSQFWDALKLDQVKSQKVANELYDTAVNMGVSTATKFLQRALNVSNINGKYYPDLTVDGIIGTKTISALNAHPNQEVIYKILNCLQGARYIEIAEKNKSQEAFINGWFKNRV